MNEARILHRLKRGDAGALSEIIEKYTAYVYAIASNIMVSLPPEDIEEVTADSFITLWNRRECIAEGKLKAYLAAIVRSRAKDRLRKAHIEEPYKDGLLNIETSAPDDSYALEELGSITRKAVDTLGEPDSEIFKRHYFLYQRTEDIASALGMSPSAVRVRLMRGRDKLKAILNEMGVSHEDIYT